MKHLIYLCLIAFITVQCQSNSGGDGKNKKNDKQKGKDTMTANAKDAKQQKKRYDTVHYGKKIDEQGAMNLTTMLDSMGDKKEYHTKVSGEVTAVCQKKGCWMKLKNTDGNDIRITFKDYGFFVPKDLTGEKVAMKGRAYVDTISVKARRPFAKDAGKSEEEIKQINEPKQQVAFKATGVKILQ